MAEISKNIVSYDNTDYAWASSSNMSNGYAGSTSSNYATINFVTGANAVSYVYWNFGSLADIPENATDISVSCMCRCLISSTSSTRIATRTAQLFSGTTAKGTAANVPNSSTAFAVSAGSWTRAELLNARLRTYAKRGSSSTTNDYYFRFYGATITVTYNVPAPPGPSYDVRVKQNGNWVQATKVLVKNNGSWVEASGIKAKSGGSWH